MVVADAVSRMIPGVLGAASGAQEDSFYEPLLECPQYTKPPEFRGWTVPDVLRSGHHKKYCCMASKRSLKADTIVAARFVGTTINKRGN